MAGHLKGAAGAGGRLLKQQNDVLALQVLVQLAGLFLGLQLGREVNEVANLIRGEVQKLQEVASAQIDSHGPFLSYW